MLTLQGNPLCQTLRFYRKTMVAKLEHVAEVVVDPGSPLLIAGLAAEPETLLVTFQGPVVVAAVVEHVSQALVG